MKMRKNSMRKAHIFVVFAYSTQLYNLRLALNNLQPPHRKSWFKIILVNEGPNIVRTQVLLIILR